MQSIRKSSDAQAVSLTRLDNEKIASLSKTLSDDIRVKIITLLLSKHGQEMITMDLATRLGQVQPRITSHLSILKKHGLVVSSKQGRQRFYSLSNERQLTSVLRGLSSISSSEKSTHASRGVMSNSAIRQCRTCYDHLAGVSGVALLKAMLDKGWLTEKAKKKNKPYYTLMKLGRESLLKRSVDIESALRSKRAFAYGCLDWTERRPHLAGSLGSLVLKALISKNYVVKQKGTRALKSRKSVLNWI